MIGLGSHKNLTGNVSEQKKVPVSFSWFAAYVVVQLWDQMFMRHVRSATTMTFFLSLSSQSEIVASTPMQCVFGIQICIIHIFQSNTICVSLQKTIINNLRLNPAPFHGYYWQNNETVKKGWNIYIESL